MIKEIKSRINKPVFLISAVAGGILWFFCNYLYSTYRLKIAGFLMFPALCTFLFTVLFLIIWISSVVTGSFDKKNHLYTSIWGMLKYFSLSIVIIFFLSMLLEYLYELNPNQKITEPTSYIFVIDESASMSSNDPNGLRYNAISEIMNSPENTLPYMVYAFSSESRILRDMGYLTSNEEEIPINCDGATSIRETTLRILQDYKDKKWSGGKNPKIIFLTDGFATDLDNGFLWFKGNVPEFNTALEEYSKLGISISTVGLGSVDKQLMRKMAETTGGTFISINQAEDLADAMNTAATSYSERNLLSIRYMKHLNMLFGCLRVLFLIISFQSTAKQVKHHYLISGFASSNQEISLNSSEKRCTVYMPFKHTSCCIQPCTLLNNHSFITHNLTCSFLPDTSDAINYLYSGIVNRNGS